MGSRGVQAALVVVVLCFGVVAALAVGGARKHQTANNNGATASPQVTPSASASPSPSPSPSPSASASAAPSPSPVPSPTTAPQATPATQPPPPSGGGAAPYPAQITAGSTYSYRGSGVLVAHATDSIDGGTSACAGINENTQAFPSGDQGVFFVGVQFPDGQILSAGYIRKDGARKDFATIQNGDGSARDGVLGADPGAGSHTYCVSRSGSAWVMTRDGSQLFSTTREGATDIARSLVKFDSNLQPSGNGASSPSTLVVPGFHDIAIGGNPPRQLRGSLFYA